MKFEDIKKITIDIVEDYYKGNMETFFDHLHPNVVFISVGKGQIFEGKENIATMFKSGMDMGINYDFEQISCKAHKIEKRLCLVVLDSEMITCYPNASVERVNQRISVVWKYISKQSVQKEDVEKEGWYAMHIHASIGKEASEKALPGPHFSVNVLAEMMRTSQNEERVILRDTNSFVHYIPRSQIIRIEAEDYKSRVYINDGTTIYISKRLKETEQELTGEFVRIHRCHLINAQYVKMVKNYKVTMLDGTLLPIPKENYASIKKAISTACEYKAEHPITGSQKTGK